MTTASDTAQLLTSVAGAGNENQEPDVTPAQPVHPYLHVVAIALIGAVAVIAWLWVYDTGTELLWLDGPFPREGAPATHPLAHSVDATRREAPPGILPGSPPPAPQLLANSGMRNRLRYAPGDMPVIRLKRRRKAAASS